VSLSVYDTTTDGVVLRVHVEPGAGRDAIVGTHGNALKIRVAAPPVSGRANEAVLSLLGRELGVASGDLAISAGTSSRAKRVKVTGVDAEEFAKRLDPALEKPSLPKRRR
jgi:uncharacterized protein (TIGR00251 family)